MKTRASLRYFVTDCRQYHQTQDLDSTASALVSTDMICDQSKKGEKGQITITYLFHEVT